MVLGWLFGRSAPVWVGAVLLCLVFGLACHGARDVNGGRNLLLGKKPLAASGVSASGRLTDGVAAEP